MSSGPVLGSVAVPVGISPKFSPTTQMPRPMIMARIRAGRAVAGKNIPAAMRMKATASTTEITMPWEPAAAAAPRSTAASQLQNEIPEAAPQHEPRSAAPAPAQRACGGHPAQTGAGAAGAARPDEDG